MNTQEGEEFVWNFLHVKRMACEMFGIFVTE